MKRLIVCFDGTWNTLANPKEATNVVRVAQAVKPQAADGTTQIVYYNSGVGSGGTVDQLLGGVFGAGVKGNVKRGLTFLSFNYDTGESPDGRTPDGDPDEIYIFGFSRGAYTARALAGVIGAIGGIPKVSSFGEAEALWSHYRKTKRGREKSEVDIAKLLYPPPKNGKPIKCVAVWDTVGSYGIPTGMGLGGLARWATSWTRNFRDNEISDRIEYGFHALAIDERRRSFFPTAWVPRTTREDDSGRPPLPEPDVEQVWFAGAHANVGGGYAQSGLSDHALIWMISRVQDKTKLEFDQDYIRDHFLPCSACSLYRSSRGWWLSSLLPYVRSIPKSIATAAGAPAAPAKDAIVDGRLHWSVKDRLGKLGLVDRDRYRPYAPKNVTEGLEYTAPSETELNFIQICHDNPDNKMRQDCALRCDLTKMERGWWWERAKARRMRRLRESWEARTAAQG